MGRGGELSALSSPPMNAPVWSGAYVRGFALRAQGGGYEVDYSGGVRAIGGAPDIAQSAYFPGWDIVRGIALNPDGNGGYVLDGFGGVWPIGNAAPVVTAGYFANWDIARDIVVLPTSTATNPAGYVMDAWGGLHPFGSAPKITQGGYWPGWDIARDVIINPNGPGGWVLDGWGGLSAFNGAPAVNISRYWPGLGHRTRRRDLPRPERAHRLRPRRVGQSQSDQQRAGADPDSLLAEPRLRALHRDRAVVSRRPCASHSKQHHSSRRGRESARSSTRC